MCCVCPQNVSLLWVSQNKSSLSSRKGCSHVWGVAVSRCCGLRSALLCQGGLSSTRMKMTMMAGTWLFQMPVCWCNQKLSLSQCKGQDQCAPFFFSPFQRWTKWFHNRCGVKSDLISPNTFVPSSWETISSNKMDIILCTFLSPNICSFPFRTQKLHWLLHQVQHLEQLKWPQFCISSGPTEDDFRDKNHLLFNSTLHSTQKSRNCLKINFLPRVFCWNWNPTLSRNLGQKVNKNHSVEMSFLVALDSIYRFAVNFCYSFVPSAGIPV